MTSNTEILLELEMYLERYRKGLEDIITAIDDEDVLSGMPLSLLVADINRIARSALDGEPTTADEYNEVQNYGPPYSMANPSGELKKGVQDDPEC